MKQRGLAIALVVSVFALLAPAATLADHLITTANVSARMKARRSADSWLVEIRWTAACNGATPGTACYDGDLYLVDVDSGERIYAGGVVDTSGRGSA